MRALPVRSLRTVALALALVACDANRLTAPRPIEPAEMAVPRVGGAGFATAPKVVISQVYGGGGNTSAPYSSDFVELFNAGDAPQNLTGWSVQYASAAGTGNFGSATNLLATLSGSIAPGQYYLVKLASGGAVGAALPSADASGTINMSGTAGKVALSDQATSLACNTALTCASVLSHIIDLVGFGSANFFEGTGPTATLSNTTAAFRADHGCTDTNVNSADFTTGTPAPRNSATAFAPCVVIPPTIGPLDHIVITGGTSVAFGSTITLSAELQDATNQTITDPAATFTWTSADPLMVQVLSTTGNTAVIKGLAPGGPTLISVSATSNSVTKAATPGVTVFGGAVLVPSTTFVSEVHYDNTGVDANEAVEIEGDANTSLNGWSLVFYNGTAGSGTFGVYNTIALSGTFPATCGARGVLVFPVPANPGIQNGNSDGWALMNAQGQITELTSYEGTFTATSGPAAGLTSTETQANESITPTADKSIQRAGNGVWFGPRANTFGACNPALPLGAQGSVALTSGKVELALGMQTQFFFSGTDASGVPVTSVVYSTSNSAIITVDAKGVVTAKGLGAAQLIATAPDGATGTVDMTVYLAAGSTGIRLGHNTEFGEPHDADPSDDFLIRRPQYTVSYNPNHGGANWVSWNLDASHVGINGRCPGTCYSADTALSNAGLPAYTTADWVSGSTYDRGHMSPSADWTSSEADNNTTFFLSNFLPQQPDLNQGPWEVLESALRDSVSAANGSREAYIISGGIFANGTGLGSLLGLGKVWIPNSTYKIAVITPAGTGMNADGTLPPNTTVLAVNMPNVAGIRGTLWTSYLTSIASIEQATGYNFLELLRDDVECRVEGRNCAPTARLTSAISGAGWQANEGQAVGFIGSTSSDPDVGDALTYGWTFGDGGTATVADATHSYADNGTYTVTLTVTDSHGAVSTVSQVVTVANVAPTATFVAPSTVVEGSSFTLSLAGATDASPVDAAALTFAFDCGDGSGFGATGAGASANCPTTDNGTRSVRARVFDKDGALTEYTGSTAVSNAAPVVTAFTATSAPLALGQSATVTVSFSDVGALDTHSLTVSWGDGTSSTVDAALATTATLSHAYTATGFYAVSATVTDKDGASAAASTASVVVYDTLSSMRSDGWFYDPSFPAPNSGKDKNKIMITANAAYDANVANGKFDLDNKTTGLHLRSSSLDYLVVTGAIATARGVGSIDGGPQVGFLAIIRDGKLAGDRLDKVRFKIWNLGTGAVLYDTEPGVAENAAPATTLGGGENKIGK